jgi:hypothetical protein
MNLVKKYYAKCKCGHPRYGHYLFNEKCGACDCTEYRVKLGRPSKLLI